MAPEKSGVFRVKANTGLSDGYMLWVHPGVQKVTVWLFNRFTPRVALLVIHTIVIRKVRTILSA